MNYLEQRKMIVYHFSIAMVCGILCAWVMYVHESLFGHALCPSNNNNNKSLPFLLNFLDFVVLFFSLKQSNNYDLSKLKQNVFFCCLYCCLLKFVFNKSVVCINSVYWYFKHFVIICDQKVIFIDNINLVNHGSFVNKNTHAQMRKRHEISSYMCSLHWLLLNISGMTFKMDGIFRIFTYVKWMWRIVSYCS